jgi:hypothetical protein
MAFYINQLCHRTWCLAPISESSRWLLSHDKLDTTARYTRVATGMIAGIYLREAANTKGE